MSQENSARIAVLVPVYNHAEAVGQTLARLALLKLPVILVDDGSDAHCAGVLDALAEAETVDLVRLAVNRGKGATSRFVDSGDRHRLGRRGRAGWRDPIHLALSALAAKSRLADRWKFDLSRPRSR